MSVYINEDCSVELENVTNIGNRMGISETVVTGGMDRGGKSFTPLNIIFLKRRVLICVQCKTASLCISQTCALLSTKHYLCLPSFLIFKTCLTVIHAPLKQASCLPHSVFTNHHIAGH